jgi:hypothetical protein
MNSEHSGAASRDLKTVVSFTVSILMIPAALLLMYLVLVVVVPWLADVTGFHPAGWGDLVGPFVG